MAAIRGLSGELAEWARKQGAETPFIRESALSESYVDIAKVMQYSLARLEEKDIYPDLIVSLEITFPFRPPGLLDDMILQLTQNGFDSVIAAKKENKAIWSYKDNQIVQLLEGLTPRQYKDPTYIELRGIACVTHPEFIRMGRLMGDRIGIYDVSDPTAQLEVRSKEDVLLASRLLKLGLGEVRHAAKIQ